MWKQSLECYQTWKRGEIFIWRASEKSTVVTYISETKSFDTGTGTDATAVRHGEICLLQVLEMAQKSGKSISIKIFVRDQWIWKYFVFKPMCVYSKVTHTFGYKHMWLYARENGNISDQNISICCQINSDISLNGHFYKRVDNAIVIIGDDWSDDLPC